MTFVKFTFSTTAMHIGVKNVPACQ